MYAVTTRMFNSALPSRLPFILSLLLSCFPPQHILCAFHFKNMSPSAFMFLHFLCVASVIISPCFSTEEKSEDAVVEGKNLRQARVPLISHSASIGNEVALLATDSSSARDTFLKAELNSFNSFITDAAIRQLKYTDMSVGKFEYYRATAHIFYKDLNLNQIITIPTVWKTPTASTAASCATFNSVTKTCKTKTWIEGDSHTLNFGFFHNDKSPAKVKFDMNDFDESYVAPFYWDLLRLSISIYLHQGLTSGKCRASLLHLQF